MRLGGGLSPLTQSPRPDALCDTQKSAAYGTKPVRGADCYNIVAVYRPGAPRTDQSSQGVIGAVGAAGI